MLHNSLVYCPKNSAEEFHNLYRIIVPKIYQMVCNSYMIEHKNKNVSIIIRSKKLPETISLIDKSQDSREAKLLTQHFCKSSRSKCGAHKKYLFVLWQSNKTVKREREKFAFKKTPVAMPLQSTYLWVWGAGGFWGGGVECQTMVIFT